MSEKLMPIVDLKRGRLLPPVSCSAGRCEWEYNDRGYQCSEPAVWCSPSLNPDNSFRWWKLCDIHKGEAEKELEPMRKDIARRLGGPVENLRNPWQRIDQQNAEVRQVAGRTVDNPVK